MAWNIPFDHWLHWIRMIDMHKVFFVIKNIFFILTAVVFLWGFVANWLIFFNGFVRRKKTSSWVPLFIGVIGSVSFATSPFHQLKHMWWLPPLIEWGSVPNMAYMAMYYLIHRKKTDDRTDKSVRD